MGAPLKVLFVEDSEDDTLLVVRYLDVGGLKVTHRRVDTVETLRAALADGSWDVILCDYTLPRMTALQAINVARGVGFDGPLLIVSGTIGEERAADVMRAGASDLILKGNLLRLIPAIERGLQTAEVQRERKRALEELQASELRFKDFAEASSDWFWEMGPDLKFVYHSQRYFEITGFRPEDKIGTGRKHYVEPSDLEHEAEKWRAHMADLDACRPFRNFEYRFKDAHGNLRQVLTSGVPIVAEDGAFLGYRGTGSDITDVRRTERQLQQAQKMEAVGNLTGGIAHDFNNILAVILGNLQLLRRRAEGNAEFRKMISSATDATKRGAELTKQLLAFSRLQELAPKVLDVNVRLDGSLTLLRRTLGEQIEIRTELAPTTGHIKVDPAQFETMILNLAINARDAMPEGGRLMIETSNVELDDTYLAKNPYANAGSYVCISVTDTGVGIPEEIRERIFEPFFTTKEIGKGTGLGLSMVYGFVKQSGGHVNVYSEVGHGTRFRLYFLRTNETGTPVPLNHDEETTASPGGAETVLVVEDDELVRDVTVLMFEELGYKVVSETDGPSAIKALEAGVEIDLLFSDMIMPGGMAGHQLAERVLELRPEMKVLLASGYSRHTFTENRRFPMISKPYTEAELARAVRHVLEGKETSKD